MRIGHMGEANIDQAKEKASVHKMESTRAINLESMVSTLDQNQRSPCETDEQAHQSIKRRYTYSTASVSLFSSVA